MDLIPRNIETYCISHSTPINSVAYELEEYTKSYIHGSQMLIGPLEANVLQFILKLNGAKNVLEFGTYTGYSALIMALVLPENGRVTTVDVNSQTTEIAKKYWTKAQVEQKITPLIMPGLEALKILDDKYDLIFIDADKGNYSNYLKWSLEHLSSNGVIVSDNTLWSGRVLENTDDKQTKSIQEHNTLAAALEGYQKVLLPIRDGMYLISKLSNN